VPYGQGIGCIWMLGVPEDQMKYGRVLGEIDIMGNTRTGTDNHRKFLHGFPGYSGGEAIFKEYVLQNDRLDTSFHIYWIEWGPDM